MKLLTTIFFLGCFSGVLGFDEDPDDPGLLSTTGAPTVARFDIVSFLRLGEIVITSSSPSEALPLGGGSYWIQSYSL